jgi:ribosomal-protein-alanine N-acetyltransferase
LTFNVRPMEREDLEQVNQIDREAFPTQWPPPNYRQELRNRLAHYLVAVDDTRKLPAATPKPPQNKPGFFTRLMPFLKSTRSQITATPPRPPEYIVGFAGIWMMVDEAHITNIAVSGEYRRRGIGELLLVAMIDLVRDLKARNLTLEVRISNTIAQNLYIKYGFKRQGIRRGYYLDNREDAIIMTTDDINSPSFLALLGKLREALAKKLG